MQPLKVTLGSLALATAVIFATTAIQAATLTGTTITQVDPTGTHNVLVGSGVDLTENGFDFNYDAGANGNEFVISTTNGGGFFGIYNFGVTDTITLSNLNFSGGEVLTGFTVLSSVFPITVSGLTAHSVSLSWNEGAFNGPVTFLDGEFDTAPVATPLPTALPLFATGLAGLGLLGWRRKRKA